MDYRDDFSGMEDICHQFIVDGYDIDEYYHFNWGWGGYQNGKYTILDNLYPTRNGIFLTAPEDNSTLIEIEDPNFESCIINQLELENKNDIRELTVKYYGDGWKSLECNGTNITTANEVTYFENLYGLDLRQNSLESIDLNGTKNIHWLYLGDNNLTSLDLSNANKLQSIYIYDNDIFDLKLSLDGHYDLIGIYNNPLNILQIENLKNIDTLYAYDTIEIFCWQKNALKAENNISNIYIGCTSTNADDLDTDNDGIKNVDDPDDDNDGINDLKDDDIDGDGINNPEDAFPLDASESVDTDGDGIGDNADADDDNDGLSDTKEAELGTDPLLADTDGDGVSDNQDAFPLDASRSERSGDGGEQSEDGNITGGGGGCSYNPNAKGFDLMMLLMLMGALLYPLRHRYSKER